MVTTVTKKIQMKALTYPQTSTLMFKKKTHIY